MIRALASMFRRKPTPAEAARVLSEHANLTQRERVKAVARQMRKDLGLPPAPELDPRK